MRVIISAGGTDTDEANYRDNVAILQNLNNKNIEGVSCTFGAFGDNEVNQSGCNDSSVSLTVFINQTPSVWVQSSDFFCPIWSGEKPSSFCAIE